PARARQLLAESGYASGFETSWVVSSGVYLKDMEVAEATASQLRQVGIRVNLLPVERATAVKNNEVGNFQGITTVTWGAQFEPGIMLGWLNRPHFTLPRIQELIDAGQSEVDVEKRRQIYQELYRLAHDEALWLFIHAQDELWAKRRSVTWSPYNVSGSKAFV